MSTVKSEGSLRMGPMQMKKFEKKFFDTYSEGEIWLLNGGFNETETDGILRIEAGRWYIFVRNNNESNSQ